MMQVNHKNHDDTAASTSVPQANLMSLPEEILTHILSYLNYECIAKLRFVCVRINRVCGHALNKGFEQFFKIFCSRYIKKEGCTENEAYEFKVMRILGSSTLIFLKKLRRNMRPFITTKRCVFYPGKIIDFGYKFLQYGIEPRSAWHEVLGVLYDYIYQALTHFDEHLKPFLILQSRTTARTRRIQ